MPDDLAIRVERVSKKYCKNLRRSMTYGLRDLSRNAFGLRSRSDVLRRDEFWALDDVDLRLKRGESVGLIGPNGSGKTTLLKMINGIFWPDKGRIDIRGRVGALIAVGAGFHPLLTGRENVFINGAILGMNRQEIDARFDAIVDFAGIGEFIDTPVKHYSSGMFVRLGFAVAAHAEPDIMLVDEVLAVGDRGFQTKCFKKMGELRARGTTFVVVSHNMHTVTGFSDWVALLVKGKLVRYDNAFEGVREYSRLFMDEPELERLVSAGAGIEFHDVQLPPQKVAPGASLSFVLPYTASRAYEDVEVDLAIYDPRDPDMHFQATNRAHGVRVDLREGGGALKVTIRDVRLSGTVSTVVVAVWDRGRTEQLFWWRVPIEIESAPHSNGKSFLDVEYEVAT